MKKLSPNPAPSSRRVFISCLLSFTILITPLAAFARSAGSPTVRKGNLSKTSDKASKSSARAALISPPLAPPQPFVPTITATKVDSLENDDGDGKIDPTNGNPATTERIKYTVTISNSVTDATGVAFADTIDSHTTLVAGSLNVSPLAGDDTYATIGNTLLEVGPVAAPSGSPKVTVNGSVLDNDTDFLGAPAPTLKTPFPTTSTNGGTVAMESNGHFSYTPAANFTGADTFTYTITDAGADAVPGNADDLTSTATVTINVNTQKVWYVKNDVAGPGTGTSTNPFNTLLQAQTASAAGDTIYVFTGNGTTTGQSAGITLKANQRFIGNGVQLDVPVSVNGGPNPTVLRAAGSAPSITNTGAGGNGVTVTNIAGVSIRGFIIGGNLNAIAASFNVAGGGVTISNNVITGGTANAIDVTTVATTVGGCTAIISSNTISGAGAEGIDINGQGTGGIILALDSEAITSTGDGVNIDGTTGGVTITSLANNSVSGTSGANGVKIQAATFDSNPGVGGLQPLTAGTLTIGASGAGNGVGASGLVLVNTSGTLPFTALNVFTDNGRGIDATGSGAATSGLTANSGAIITAVGGAAVFINGNTIDLQNAVISSTNSADNGVMLGVGSGVNGTFSATNGSSITNAAGDDFAVGSGTANITWNASLNNSNGGNAVDVTGHSGGTVSFTGAITDTVQGINLSTNTNATINFVGGLNINTGANTAFSAVGGGTVNVCDENPCLPNATGALVNTLTTTTATALKVTNTNIGSNNLEFKSISSSGGSATGIILDTTGASGGLKVVGDGSNTSVGGNSTGGTIANKSGTDGQTTSGIGIYLNSTSNVVLRRMTINGTNQNHGIKGLAVNNFTLEYSTVAGTNGTNPTLANPDQIGEGSIVFGSASSNGITGTGTFTNLSVSGARGSNLIIENSGAAHTTTVTVKGSTFGAIQNFTDGGHATQFMENTSGSTFNLIFGGTLAGEGNTITSAVGNSIAAVGAAGTTMDAQIRNNSISDNHAFNISGGGIVYVASSGVMTSHITGNTMRDANGSALTLFKATVGTSFISFVDNNTIGVAGIADSGSKTGNGIFVSAGGAGSMSFTITNNTIQQIKGNAHIYADNTGGSYAANFDIRHNTFGNWQATNFAAVAVTNGSPGSGDTINACAVIGGSTAGDKNIFNIGANLGVIVGASGSSAPTHTFNLPGYAGGANLTNVQNFISGNNTMNTATVSAYTDAPVTASAFTGTGTNCGTPVSMYKPEKSKEPFEVASAGHAIQNSNSLLSLLGERSDSTSIVTSLDRGFISAPISASSEASPVLAQASIAGGASASTGSSSLSLLTRSVNTLGRLARAVDSVIEPTAYAETTEATKQKAEGSKTRFRDQKSEVRLNHARRSNSKLSNTLAPMPSGETVNATIGTLPAGKSVTIVFTVTLNNPPNLSLLNPPRVRNQGTVSGSNFSSVLTDDTAVGGASDPTDTPVDLFNSQTVVVSSQPGGAFEGDSVTFTATVSQNQAGSPGTPTGTVQFLDGASPITCSENASSTQTLVSGVATCTTTALLAAGSPHTINANYSGDGNFDTSSGNVSQTITACTNNPVVTTIADSGAGSLRAAITTACSGSTITFDTAGVFATPQTITLLTELSVGRNVTIDGPDAAANHVTISGNNVTRVFNINPGKTDTIRDVTITGGLASGVFPANAGGGVYNDHGTLTLNTVTISGNTANFGGGVYNNGTTSSSASLTIINSTLSGNTANADGGGVYNAGTGGGTATLTVNNSTLSGNNAKTSGGGIFSDGTGGTASLTTTNATVTNNRADSDDTAGGDGGGLSLSTGTYRLRNTIVAGNFKGTASPIADDIFGTVDTTVASSNNLIGTGGTGGLTATNGNQINVATPGLGALANNGGPTLTHRLLFGSPAIEAGDNTFSDAVGLTTDQRGTGFIRKADSADANTTQTVDIGAFEAQATIEDITDKTTAEDTPLVVSNFNVGDGVAPQITSVTATSSNTGLVSNANAVITGSGSTRTLTLTPTANQFGTSTITVTVNAGSESMQDTFVLTVTPAGDQPSITGATTNEDTQTTSGLVITKNAADGAEVGFFKITGITGGTLFKNDGTTQINNNDVITEAEGNAGLKFTPTANLFSPTTTFSFQAQGATDNLGNGTGAAGTGTITVNPVADTPSVTNATTNEDTQTTSGLVISRNAADSTEVTHFKITGITNGTLFQNNGTTQINNGDFITFAQGNAGLKFTPAANLFSPTTSFSFTVQASTSNVDAGLGGSTVNATITVNAVADTPSVTNATTNEDVQTTSGLVISRNAADGAEVTHFKITSITNGALFQNDGTTPIVNGQFITFAEGNAGLKFTPAANFSGNGSFQVQAATDGVGGGLSAGFATATITVGAVADVPTVTPATTNEDTQTSTGLVITKNAADGAEVTHFKITNITNGTLFQNNGTTQINNGDFITVAQGGAGLKFTPSANLYSPVSTFSFDVQGATSSGGAGLGTAATASITVNPVADTPSVTNAVTAINTQTSSGLVISRNVADSTEVTHFKITNITNGTLFQNDGTTPINNNDFITFAQGNAGLKFTPGLNLTDPTVFGFDVQASLNNTNGGIGGGTAHATINVNCTSPQVVTSTLDDGSAGTLRYAVLNICPTGNITFNLPAGPQTITLTSQITINKDVTIIGPASQAVTVNGGGAGRVFNITTGNVNISNLTITGGTVAGSNGGGLLNAGAGTVTLTAMTISGNGADNGGGIATTAGTLNLYNSTISGNTATTDGGGVWHNTAGTVNFLNTTVTNNTATAGQGGGLRAAGGTTNVKNTIIAGNTAPTNADVGGTIVDQGNNVLSGDPKLSPLANNGGPTQTHALKPGSPALDAGDNTAATNAGLTTDQRGAGFGRIRDAASDADTTQTVDIGAFEADPSVEDITDKATTEDTALPSFIFKVADSFTAFDSITATSSNTTLVPNANVVVGADTASTRTLSITPAADQSGTTTITVTVTKTIGSTVVSMSDTFVLTVGTVPDTPSVTNAVTNEDTQTTSGLVITRNAVDGAEITHFKITNITGGTLFLNDGVTVITNNSFITAAQGNAGLKFTPAPNSFAPGSFQVQSSTDAVGTVLSPGAATATITVNAIADTPSVTNATTNEDTQTTSGLVISRNAADGAEVTHFKITGITNGNLFKSDGTTPINNGDFITFAEGNAGLKFTPAANLFSPGSTFSFIVQAATSGGGAGLSSGSATATITVNPVADTPSVTNATTLEDTQTSSGLVITRNPADGAEVTNFKITGITGGTLFQNNGTTVINNNDFITVAQGGAGLRFTPTANSNANGSFQVQASLNNTNAGLGGGLATATITVTPVNDAPTLDALGNLVINEDAPLQTVNLTGISAGGGETQTLVITATSNNTSVVPNPTVNYTSPNATGSLTFTPVANANGLATITVTVNDGGGTANGGIETVVRTFTVTVNAVNDAPSFTKGPDQTVNEDAAAQTVNNWATGISPGPADESGQTVTFQVTGNTNAALFSALPAISPTGTLTYTPAANANGSATITIALMDNGGTALGGQDTSATQTFTITVNAVNDTPSFTKGANQTVNEDAGLQTVANWATAISPGPANESSQTVSFNVTNNNNSLFSGQPAVSSTGTLTYTPAANANGLATVSVSISDNGGTANGGSDTSAIQTFTITVNAVNDAPSFTKGPDLTIQDPNPQTVNNWATNISAGPPDESGQTLTFLVSNNANALFSAQPAISPNGTLTFTAAAGQDGVATVTVRLMDNGGTALGGVDTSAPQTFTITVHALNNAPTLNALSNVVINEDAPLQTVNLSGITPGPSFESNQTLTITATSSNTALIPNPTVTYTNPNTTGSISFTPLPDANGSVVITVTVKDDGGTANGGVDTFVRTFTVTVNGVNDAPVNHVPGPQNIPLNASFVFSTATGNAISISDVDAGSDALQVTLKATDGTLTLNGTAGLSFTTGDGTDDPTMTFTGSLASINAALQGLKNLAFGSGVITITTNDLGHNGAGGPLSDTDTIQVTVADNLAPQLLTIAGTDRAIAFESTSFVIDPFNLQVNPNFIADNRTHIMLFALHAQLRPGETASAITAVADVDGTIVPLIVESVNTVPNFDWLTQIVVKFPDGFSTGGGGPHDAKIRITLRGQTSNQAVIVIVPAPKP